MSVQILKFDNGEEFKFDASSYEFQGYQNIAQNIASRQDEAFFFARNLEFVRQKIFTPTYAELKLLNGSLLPLNTSIPDGAVTDTYDILDSTGNAKIVGNYADDIPTVAVMGTEQTNSIHSIKTSYIYSKQDARQDRMFGNAGRSVITNKALSARKALDQELNNILAFGSVEYGIAGMFSNANVPLNAVAGTGSGASTLWSTKTAPNILADVDSAIQSMIDVSNGNEVPNHLLLDSTSYFLIRNKPLDISNYSGMTVLKYIEQEYNLKVEAVQQLKSRFANNTKSGFVLYNNSSEKLEGVIPLRLEPQPPELVNSKIKIILEARCGGTRVFYPYSMSYSYGI